ncbi:MAG: Rieske 2Fe-2S domain-containing protein [Hormoscilla sp. GUM202]|nr:Rieske 2Fe-2S domain-containing protein [Hormoscilla sp. GUM202]
MIYFSQQSWIKLFLEAGRLQNSISNAGNAFANSSLQDWEFLISDLIYGRCENPVIKEARDLLEVAVTEYNNLNHEKLDPKKVNAYFAAKVVRSIIVEQKCLSGVWHPLCSLAEIAYPGDFVTARIFQESLVALRQADKTLRVFLNICPHRQAKLIEGKGCLNLHQPIVCPYHGWIFSQDGRCQNVPGAAAGEFGAEFDINNYFLQELETKIYQNSIFVKLQNSGLSDKSTDQAEIDKSESEELVLPVSIEGKQSIRVTISQLLQSVYPGANDIKSPEVPESIRLLLKVGYLDAEIKRLSVNINQHKNVSNKVVSLPNSEPENLYLESLIIEIKQAILTLNNIKAINLNIDELFPCINAYPNDITTSKESVSNPNFLTHSSEPLQNVVLPEKDRKTLPPWVYANPNLFPLEVERIIKPTWQFVCHESEVSNCGDFTWLDIVGERAYVIRTSDGGLFAGRLRIASELYSRPDFTVPNYGLEQIDIDVWLGFVFIRFLPNDLSVADVWENPKLITPYKFQDLQPIFGSGWYDFEVEADYKILWENFLEVYHFPVAHKGMTRLCHISRNSDLLPFREPPLPNLPKVEFDYIQSLKAAERHSQKHEKLLLEIAEKTKVLPEPLHYTIFGSISKQRLMPIMLGLTVFPEHIQAMSFIPVGPEECRVRIRSYGLPLDLNTSSGRAIQDARTANINDIQIELVEEDIKLNYLTQAGVSSKIFDKQGILNDLEISIAQFQEKIRKDIPITRCLYQPEAGTLRLINQKLLIT